jgi:hypothetical protein
MMLTETVLEGLQLHNLKLEQFQAIVQRLFAWGIMVRAEDGAEQRLYDDARRIEGLLLDYFALAGFRLLHDSKNEFFRLYAPGATIPGQSDDGLEALPSLRAKLSADFVAAALALRFLYQQGLTQGGSSLSDEGDVYIRFEDLATTLQTQLKRLLPEGLTERARLLDALKRHRLLYFKGTGQAAVGDEDVFLVIRPTVLGIISEDTLAAALEAEGAIEHPSDDETTEEASA